MRFNCVVQRDWGTVLALLQADRVTARQRQEGRRGRVQQVEYDTTAQAKLRKTVLSLLKRGQIGRAVRRICSHGIRQIMQG